MIGSYLGKKYREDWARQAFGKASVRKDVNPFQEWMRDKWTGLNVNQRKSGMRKNKVGNGGHIWGHIKDLPDLPNITQIDIAQYHWDYMLSLDFCSISLYLFMVFSSLKKEMRYSYRIIDVHRWTDAAMETNKTIKQPVAPLGLFP